LDERKAGARLEHDQGLKDKGCLNHLMLMRQQEQDEQHNAKLLSDPLLSSLSFSILKVSLLECQSVRMHHQHQQLERPRVLLMVILSLPLNAFRSSSCFLITLILSHHLLLSHVTGHKHHGHHGYFQ